MERCPICFGCVKITFVPDYEGAHIRRTCPCCGYDSEKDFNFFTNKTLAMKRKIEKMNESENFEKQKEEKLPEVSMKSSKKTKRT